MIRKSPGPAVRGARRFAVLALCGLLVAACTDEAPDEEPPVERELPLADVRPVDRDEVEEGGTLRLGVGSFPATFNPVHTDGVASTAPQILAPTRGSAVRVAEDGTWSVDPDYASSVEIVDRDPFTVRVELNEDAVWQGGTSITSADMVAFVDAMQDEDFAAAPAEVFDDVESVEPDGDFAYEIVFERPHADWPAAVYPVLPRAFTKSAAMFNEGMRTKAPSSNGPFVVSAIERRTGTISLERNPRWWGEPPRLESIVWRIGDPEVLAKAFLAGELDATPVLPANLGALAEEDLRSSISADWTHLTINGGTGPLSEPEVRRAVVAAVDVDEIVAEASRRHGVETVTRDSLVLAPGQLGHESTPPRRRLDEARSLLREAGWKPGDDGVMRRGKQRLSLRFPVPQTRSGAAERARLIAENLAEVGIEVEVEPVAEQSFFDDVVIPLDFDLTTFTWQSQAFDLGDLRRLFTPVDSPLNFTGKASKAIGEAFDAAIGEVAEGPRVEAVRELDEVARAQASILPLAVVPSVMAVHPRVVNYGPTAFADLDWTAAGFEAKEESDGTD